MKYILAAGILSLPFPALASDCYSTDQVKKVLKEKYEEVSIFYGIEAGGGLLEMYVSKDNDTWSLILTVDENTSCFVYTGSSFEEIRQ